MQCEQPSFSTHLFFSWSEKLAFGSIDILITWSIWRIIENSNHILDLNEAWFNFQQNIENFSSDATELIDGMIIYPEFTNKDLIFDSLFAVQDP